MCSCDPHRSGYCDSCSREIASHRYDRQITTNKKVAAFIYKNVPDSAEREEILLALDDTKAIQRSLKKKK